jgi:inner membrane protein
LIITLILKGFAFKQFKSNLVSQNIAYQEMDIRPAPFSTVLWTANIDTSDAYLIGNYSFFDSQPIEFAVYPKNHELLGSLATNDKIVRLINITKGWYTISEEKEKGKLLFNDLRFGLISLKRNETKFAFTYEIRNAEEGFEIIETPKNRDDAKALLQSIWQRIKGN